MGHERRRRGYHIKRNARNYSVLERFSADSGSGVTASVSDSSFLLTSLPGKKKIFGIVDEQKALKKAQATPKTNLFYAKKKLTTKKMDQGGKITTKTETLPYLANAISAGRRNEIQYMSLLGATLRTQCNLTESSSSFPPITASTRSRTSSSGLSLFEKQ